jgi:hypothetical protein
METTKIIRTKIITRIHEFTELIFDGEGDSTILEEIKQNLFCPFLRDLNIQLSNHFERAIFLLEI